MKCFIHPNQRHCPLCGGDIIIIEHQVISCKLCTAVFVDPRWARSADENHEVTFDCFEDEDRAAEEMHKMYKDIAG